MVDGPSWPKQAEVSPSQIQDRQRRLVEPASEGFGGALLAEQRIVLRPRARPLPERPSYPRQDVRSLLRDHPLIQRPMDFRRAPTRWSV